MRFRFVAKHRGVWPVTWICEVLDVSPSGFYSWLRRPPSARACYDEALMTDIRRSFADSAGTYGLRRVWPDLQDWGHAVGRERVVSSDTQSCALRRHPVLRTRCWDLWLGINALSP
jgi:putative transposase